MADGRSLKECLQENTEDLEAIIKMIVASILDKDRSCGSVRSLCESFRKKHAELVELVKKIPSHQQREQEIRRLRGEVEARDQTLKKLQENLMNAEAILTKIVFQAGQKLKEIRQAEANRVNSETIIRFANQISRSHSVAAPLGWQLGDPSRPYPTEAEFRASALAAPRVTAQTAPPALSLLRQPTSSTAGMLRSTGRGASPMTSYPAAMQQQQRSWSPRGAFVQQAQSSPRARSVTGRGGIISPRMSTTPASGLLQRRPSMTGSSPHLSSASSSYPGVNKGGLPPPVKNVEQMSSDSSSSSSSDEATLSLYALPGVTEMASRHSLPDVTEMASRHSLPGVTEMASRYSLPGVTGMASRYSLPGVTGMASRNLETKSAGGIGVETTKYFARKESNSSEGSIEF